MINLVQSSSGASTASLHVGDLSDNAHVEQILKEVRQEQQAMQTVLSQSTPSLQQMLAEMDPGFIGRA